MRTAALFLSLLSLAACAEGETGFVADDLPEAPDASKAVAVVEHDGATLSFYVSEDHQVGLVTEISDPADGSLLASFIDQDPTPLEIFELYADAPAPQALIDHHLAVAPELGLDDAPRGEEELVFQGILSPSVGKTLLTADCSLDVDKAKWQDEGDSIDANWWRYWNASSTAAKSFAPTNSKSVFLSHLCNKNRGGTVSHTVQAGSPYLGATQVVPIGKRSFMYGLGETMYTAWQSGGTSGRYRFGASAR